MIMRSAPPASTAFAVKPIPTRVSEIEKDRVKGQRFAPEAVAHLAQTHRMFYVDGFFPRSCYSLQLTTYGIEPQEIKKSYSHAQKVNLPAPAPMIISPFLTLSLSLFRTSERVVGRSIFSVYPLPICDEKPPQIEFVFDSLV